MKKYLNPSILLAGLLICLPTLSARADYQPYSYGSTRTTSQAAPNHSNGFSSDFYFQTTPGPAVLFNTSTVHASAPSGVTDQEQYYGVSWGNDTTWNWTGGGTPANFTEVRNIQQAPPVTTYTGSGAGTGSAFSYGLIYTGPSVGYHQSYMSLGNHSNYGTWTPQLVVSEAKTGSSLLWAEYVSDVDWTVGVSNGGSNTMSVMGQTTVSYVTP